MNSARDVHEGMIIGWDCGKHALACFPSSLRSDHSLRSCPKSAVADFVEQGLSTSLWSANKKPRRKAGVFYWRTERDSNPRTAFTVTHFPGVRLQPLGHLSCQGEGEIHGPVRPSKAWLTLSVKRLIGRIPGMPISLSELSSVPASRRAWLRAAAAFVARNGPLDHFVRLATLGEPLLTRPPAGSC